MNGIDWVDVFTRAFKTFVQTFLSTFTVAGLMSLDEGAALAAATSAGAAGISVVWNALLQWSNS